jgi:hypothetical protein
MVAEYISNIIDVCYGKCADAACGSLILQSDMKYQTILILTGSSFVNLSWVEWYEFVSKPGLDMLLFSNVSFNLFYKEKSNCKYNIYRS